MADSVDNRKRNADFQQLVFMLASSAMQSMGKLVNPAVGKSEVRLQDAGVMIDMLAVLKEKTKGNLQPEEERGLTEALSSLQLTYVETARAEQPEPDGAEDSAEAQPAGKDTEAGSAEQQANDSAPQATDDDDADDEQSRGNKGFHKSY